MVSEDVVSKLTKQHGMVSATGKKETALIFLDNLVHGSPKKMSPWDWSIFSPIVNLVSNALRRATRSDFKHYQDLTPIEILADNCLQQVEL